MASNALTSMSGLRKLVAPFQSKHGAGHRAASVLPAGLITALLFGCLVLGHWACDDDDKDCICCRPDLDPPAAPRDLYSITGHEQVTLLWLANTEADLDGYNVWWTDSATDPQYHLLVTLYASAGQGYVEFVHDGILDGRTYYYAVSAFDLTGNESELTPEIDDTPRPEGGPVSILSAAHWGPDEAGFDFSLRSMVPADDSAADFYYEYTADGGDLLYTGSQQGPWGNVLVQDMGWTGGFDEIGFAPKRPDEEGEYGWSPTGIVEAIPGHTYLFLIQEGPLHYFAKIRVTEVNADEHYVTFDWAYQSMPGNRQLSFPG